MTMISLTPLEVWIRNKIQIGLSTPDRSFQDALNNYHLQRLKDVINYARQKSQFYAHHLALVPEEPLNTLADMSQLPFTMPSDLSDNPWHFLTVHQEDITRIVTLRTSGSTGKPKRIFFTQEDLELTIDFFAIGMSTFVKPGQRVLILLPGDQPDSVGELLARGLKRIKVDSFAHGPVRDIKTVIDKIVSLEIDSLVGIPTQVLTLARSREGAVLKKGMIKNVLLSTDYVPQSIIKSLEEIWGCSVFNHYGMTEMGLGGGVECDAHNGYHLREADLYFEVINPETGEIIDDGSSGEIVFTTLTRKGMPLIRYRTGDIARFIREPCPCGTVLRRMECVRGRWDGRVFLGMGQTITLPEMDEALFSVPWLLNYRVTMTNHNERILLGIEVYADSDHFHQGPEVTRVLRDIPQISKAIERKSLELGPVQFREDDWFTTGVAKRGIIVNERG